MSTIKSVHTSTGSVGIREFKLSSIAPNASIVLIAKRGSGKSWVCRSLLNHFRNFPVGVIVAPTDRMSGFYKKCFVDSYIYYDVDTSIFSSILQRQTDIIQKNKEKNKIKKRIDTRCILLMDDVLAQKKGWNKDQKLLEIMQNGRHYKLTYVLAMQFSLGISPEMRSQFDYIFLLADDFPSNQKRIYDHYAGMFPNFDIFKQIFEQLTANFGCMVIVNTNRGKQDDNKDLGFLSKIYWFKAGDVPKSNVVWGCSQFNNYHALNYDKNWKNKSSAFNIDELCMFKRKNKENIKVQMIENQDDQNELKNNEENKFVDNDNYGIA
jgi:hypothetical protein